MLPSFLSDVERQQYEQVPSEISSFDWRKFFHLSDSDKLLLVEKRRPANRLGLALQIGLLRYLNYVPYQWKEQLPEGLVEFVSHQLDLPASVLDSYALREATQTIHLQEAMTYLGYRYWQTGDEIRLEPWLLERALEHDNERILLSLVCQRLGQEKILRPAIVTLERLVLGVLAQLDTVTYQRLAPVLNELLKEKLEALLVADPTLATSPHRWLAKPPISNTPKVIRAMIRKLEFLKEMNVGHWPLGVISLNRRKRLAQLARKRTSQAIARYSPVKKYPLLMAFLQESYLDITDLILLMFSDYWEGIVSRSRREMTDYQQSVVQSKDVTLQILGKAAMLILDEERIPSESLRSSIYEQVDRQQLQQAVDSFQQLLIPTRNTYLDFLEGRYGHFRRFSPFMLKEISFQQGYEGDDFGLALKLITDLPTGKNMPAKAPCLFLTPTWKKFVLNDQKEPGRHAYEICVLSTLRDRLRSGDIYVNDSRRFADLESYLVPAEKWSGMRSEVCQQLGMPKKPTDRIEERLAELESYLPLMESILQEGGDIRIEEGELVITPLKAVELPDSLKKLEKEIADRLPEVNITDILVEVDSWTGFSACLKGLEGFGAATPSEAYQRLLYAALLASGSNIPLSDMAKSTGLNYQPLWWVAHNYLREDTLKEANTILVNYHHQCPFSKYWGGGTLSSSDGQRFPVSGKIRNAKALPNYFGFGKGVTIYTHTSDQYSQYGSKVIASTQRDATHVLDEILGNETDLGLLEHTTDTSGYTDLIFALFDVLGMQFSPRIRDIKDQKLCRIKGKDLSYPELKFTGTINPSYLAHRWDDVLRVAGSFKLGYVTASLFISKLQSYPRQNNLMYVLQEYGRLIKTNFILRYLQSQPLRRKINAQLNKGEALHALRCFLWFGGDGIIRRKQESDQQEQAGCLNLLTNMIVVWNTVYMQEVISQLKTEGFPVSEEDIAHLSPSRFEHINRLGKYTFQTNKDLEANGLRPLRSGQNKEPY